MAKQKFERKKPHANVGIAVLRLLTAMAAALGDEPLRARASVAAAVREADDDELVVDADAAVRAVRPAAPSSRGSLARNRYRSGTAGAGATLERCRRP